MRKQTLELDVEDGDIWIAHKRQDRERLHTKYKIYLAERNGFDGYTSRKNVRNFTARYLNQRITVDKETMKIIKKKERQDFSGTVSRLETIE